MEHCPGLPFLSLAVALLAGERPCPGSYLELHEPQVQEALVAIVRPRLETSGYRMGQIQRTADFRTCTHHPDPRPARSALDGLLRETRRHYVARRQGAIEVEFCCGSTLYRVLVWPAAARPVVQLSEEDAADACLPDG